MEFNHTPAVPVDLGLPHKLWRPGQREGVEQIVSMWKSGTRVVMMNGPTGAGKSIISMAAAKILSQDKNKPLDVTVLTQTKDLQEQYYHEIDDCEMATGRSNWPCGVSEGTRASQCPLIGQSNCVAGCPYMVQRQRAVDAPIRAINYAFYGATGDLFHASTMVTDEADNLGDLLTQSKSVDLSTIVETYDLQIPQDYLDKDTMLDVIKDLQEAAVLPEEIEELKRANMLLSTSGLAVKGVGNVLTPWPESKLIQFFCKQPTLIMSATCFAPDYWAKRWNIPIGWVEIPSSSPAKNRPINLMNVMKINKDTTEKEWLEVVKAIDKIIDDRVESKGLVHSVSNWLTDFILENSKHKHRMYKAAGATRLSGIKAFMDKDSGVLIGPQLLRGLNLADDQCRYIIFPKVPYPSLGDPRVQEMMKGGEDAYRIETLSAIIQGCGRGVRGPQDHCETFILDSGAARLFHSTKNWLPSWFSEAIVWKV